MYCYDIGPPIIVVDPPVIPVVGTEECISNYTYYDIG
jgi:hypothetical protein